MEDSLRYIEDYFEGQLSEQERQAFEQKCESDPAFAEQVAMYLNMRGAIRAAYYVNKRKDLQSGAEEQSSEARERRIPMPVLAWASGIAATILFIAAALFFFGEPNPQQLASAYIKENLTTISVTMGVEQDSLALGVNAFNEQDFERAETIFRNLLKYPTVRFNGMKYLGVVALAQDDYDVALEQFDNLSKYEGMHANPGAFYKALTLMKRSNPGDIDEAKKILQTVVRDRMAGYKEAERWLEVLD